MEGQGLHAAAPQMHCWHRKSDVVQRSSWICTLPVSKLASAGQPHAALLVVAIRRAAGAWQHPLCPALQTAAQCLENLGDAQESCQTVVAEQPDRPARRAVNQTAGRCALCQHPAARHCSTYQTGIEVPDHPASPQSTPADSRTVAAPPTAAGAAPCPDRCFSAAEAWLWGRRVPGTGETAR